MISKNLIFLRQAKEFLSEDENYTGTDQRTSLAIANATAIIEKVLRRNLTKQAQVEYLDTTQNFQMAYDIRGDDTSIEFSQGTKYYYNQKVLQLKNWPIDLTAEFKIYYDPYYKFSEETLLSPEEYFLDPETGKLIIYRSTISYKRCIKVVYTAGYEATVDTEYGYVYDPLAVPPQEQALGLTIPFDLKMAMLYQTRFTFEMQDSCSGDLIRSGNKMMPKAINMFAVAPETYAMLATNRNLLSAVV